MNFGERTLPDTFVSDGRLRQRYDPRSNDENQLSSLRPPAGYTSSNIVPHGKGDPYSSSVSSNYLPKSRMFPLTIVHQNERIKHQPHIVAPQHEVFAHEIGHHLCNHITSPHPDLTQRERSWKAGPERVYRDWETDRKSVV